MRRALLAVGALVSLALVAWIGGCVSTPLPPPAEQPPGASRRSLRLGIERHRVAAFSDELARVLSATGRFASVDPLEELQRAPDLIASVERGWEGSAAVPFFTVLSLGLIPTIVEETHGIAFALRAPDGSPARIEIDARWSGSTWLGLASALLNASPGRTGDDVRDDPRYAEYFARKLGERQAEIESLAQRGG
jgi:hypothetical protein